MFRFNRFKYCNVFQLAAVENPPKAWPNLHPVSEAEAVKYKSSTAVKKPKIILFVNKEVRRHNVPH